MKEKGTLGPHGGGGVSPKEASGSIVVRFSIKWVQYEIGSESDIFEISSESGRLGIRKDRN